MRIPITPIREEISRIVETKEKIEINLGVFSMVPRVVTNIPGVSLSERRNHLSDCRKNIDCMRYCFEKDIPRWIPSLNSLEVIPVPIGYFEVENPLEEDLAIYFDGTTEENIFVGEFKHIGRISSNELVISKWGCGDVYLHSPELVPWQYGETLKFFRKK